MGGAKKEIRHVPSIQDNMKREEKASVFSCVFAHAKLPASGYSCPQDSALTASSDAEVRQVCLFPYCVFCVMHPLYLILDKKIMNKYIVTLSKGP